MNRFLAALFCLLAALGTRAQEPQRIAPPWQPPQLRIAAGAEQPVALRSLRIETEIAGAAALTSVEMVFHNPNRRILEGELQFPLLAGQTITGFAMDVDGKLREAVPVDKARGQAVFEDITRQRIDPGLLEATQGNNFKLRVYPIPAAGTRTVVIRYAESLAAAGGQRQYRLPIAYAPRVPELAIALRVQGARAAPTLNAATLGAPGFEARRDGQAWQATLSRRDVALRGTVELAIPAGTEPFAHTQEIDGRTFFHAEVPLAAASLPRQRPGRVAIAWDSSGSGASRDHDKEFALLEAYFRWMRDGEVVLTRIRNDAEAPERFRIAGGDWKALRTALAATVYDGATNLGAYEPPAEAEEVLLFTDGLQNFGDRRFDGKGKVVHAISAAVRADGDRLAHIARKSGGRFLDLVATTPTAAAAALSQASLRVLSVEGPGATGIVLESDHPSGGRIVVAGELTSRNARLRLDAGVPGQRPRTIEVPLDASAAPGKLAAAMWARLRIAELEGEYELNRAEIRRLGRTFGLVTRETSLIVLDRIEDYVRHEIVPPAELRADYDRLLAAGVQRREADKRNHLERIVKLFAEKQAWWAKEFPKGEKPAPVAISKDGLRERDDRAQRSESRPAMAAPASPPPPPRPAPAAAPRMAEAAAGATAKRDNANGQAAISIRLQPARPDAPYAKRMREAGPESAYRVYLDEKPGFASSTAFFLDAADILLEQKQSSLAVRVLSNLAEMDLENRHILRILGYRLLQAGEPALAIPVFRKVLALSPEEPQSYRDLGLALAADKQHQKAIEMLNEVIVRPWNNRFPEIELITLAELNAIVATAGTPLDTAMVDPRLLRNLPLDLRVILSWDADNTDIDLWVTDPNGEKAFYGNRLTWQGGRMSQDFTGGYGPEEFSLKTAKPGRYKVEAQFYGHRQQVVSGATTLQMILSTKFGTPGAQQKAVTLRLRGQNEVVLVGEFTVE